jgi:hypothetical protein
MRNLAIITGSATILAGCADLKLTGDERGGVIAYGGMGADQANTMAQQYCAKYGKHARITGAIVADYIKEPMFFECVS